MISSKSICVAIAACGFWCTACSMARLDPEQIAARISLRPTWIEVTPASLSELLQGILHLRAGVEVCNGNDLDMDLVEAPWIARLGEVNVGHGTVLGPVPLAGNQCRELVVDGQLAVLSAGASAMEGLARGRQPLPAVEIEAVGRVHGFKVHRTLRLEGFAVRQGAE